MYFVTSCDMRWRLPLPRRVRSKFARAVWSCLLILLPSGKPLTAIDKPAKGHGRFCVAVISIRKQNEEKKSIPGGRRLYSDKAPDSVRRKLENTEIKKEETRELRM